MFWKRRRRQEEPATVVENSVIEGDNVQVAHAEGDVVVYSGSPSYRLELPAATPPTSETAPPSRPTPSHLLDPRHEVVPFHPRPNDQQRLREWCLDTHPASLIWLSGPGGQGKSRLAARIAAERAADGWTVVHAVQGPHSSGREALDAHGARTAVGNRKGPVGADPPPALLVVVDYADRWPRDVLVKLVADMTSHGAVNTRRLLLLARSGGEVWADVRAQLDPYPVHLAEPFALGPLAAGPATRHRIFEEAAVVFARHLQVSVPPAPPDLDQSSSRAPDTPSPSPNSVLTLHMRALSGACAALTGETAPDADGTTRFLLDHERRYWPGASTDGTDLRFATRFPTVVLLATLCGPLTRAESVALLKRADLADADVLLHVHRRIYGGLLDAGPAAPLSAALAPLLPDRLGEDYVGTQLGDDPWSADLVVTLVAGDPDGPRPDPGTSAAAMARRCLIVLTAAGERHDAAFECLERLLKADPSLIAHANAAVLTAINERANDDLARSVNGAMPIYNTELISPALALADRVYRADLGDGNKVALARSTALLAHRFAGLGATEQALRRAEEAVGRWRELATGAPGEHHAGLAASLNGLGLYLSTLGRTEEGLDAARESTRIFMDLTQVPQAPHPGYFVSALDNLAVILRTSGRADEALAVAELIVRISGQLSEADKRASRPPLALALANLSGFLLETGRHEQAVEHAGHAVEILRELEDEELARHLPLLGSALCNLGTALSETGRSEEGLRAGLEAIGIIRELVDAAPATFSSSLARVLYEYAMQLLAAGRRREALDVALESVTLRRELAAVSPSKHRGDLAASLVLLGATFFYDGRATAAEDPSAEALTIRRELYAENPTAHHTHLEKAMALYADVLARLNRPVEARRLHLERQRLLKNRPLGQREGPELY